jgi:hypothetical protein
VEPEAVKLTEVFTPGVPTQFRKLARCVASSTRMRFRLPQPPEFDGMLRQLFMVFQASRIEPSGMFCALASNSVRSAVLSAYMREVVRVSFCVVPPPV